MKVTHNSLIIHIPEVMGKRGDLFYFEGFKSNIDLKLELVSQIDNSVGIRHATIDVI